MIKLKIIDGNSKRFNKNPERMSNCGCQPRNVIVIMIYIPSRISIQHTVYSNFYKKEREKVTLGCGTITLGCGTVTLDCGTITLGCGTVTYACGTVTIFGKNR